MSIATRLAVALSAVLTTVSRADDAHALAGADRDYLRALAADTWACIAHFVEPDTGLPFDSSKKADHTSVTNLGYYAAACAVAARMGFVSEREAAGRVTRVLDAYSRFRKWKGFSQSWNNVHTLEPSPSDTMISLLDSANMVEGFVVAARALPELEPQVDAILAGMDWKAFYDSDRDMLFGGYNLSKGEIDPGWHIGDYAGDGRFACFWAIAVGAAPLSSWEKLNRETENHYGLAIYRPAWMGGGLFMQAQDGIFLDERSTPAGRSTANFAYAQMLYAKSLNLPVWGWSACSAPDDRYLGWGGLEVNVVTPHAVGLAAMYYPRKAVECFRALEALGARAPGDVDGRGQALGFRDSVDLESKSVANVYLPPLDQGMMFLALANLLDDRIVQRLFAEHPTVKRGCELIPEYAAPLDTAWFAELHRRDTSPLELPESAQPAGESQVPIDNFEDADTGTNRRGDGMSTWQRDPNDDTVSIAAGIQAGESTGREGRVLRIDYDVNSPNPAFGGVTFGLQHADASNCTQLVLWARGDGADLKLELHTSAGIGIARLRGINPDKWQRIAIPFTRFGGMITDWHDVDRLIIVFEDSSAQPRQGTLFIDDLALVHE